MSWTNGPNQTKVISLVCFDEGLPTTQKDKADLMIISLSIEIIRGGHRATKNFLSRMSVPFRHVNFSAYSMILKSTVLAARIMTPNKNENISNTQREHVHKVNPEVTKPG